MTRQLVHPFSRVGMADPYRMWALYRRTAPAVLDPALNMWLLTGHRVCRAALLDPAFSAAQGQQQRLRDDGLPVSMLTTDGAHHQLLRAPAAAAFSARAVQGLRPAFAAIARELMAGLPGPGSSSSIDLVEELAVPYAERVLGRLLTLPEAHWPELGALAIAASANLDPMIRGERAVAARKSAERLNEFLLDHLRRRRAGASGTDLAGLPRDSGLDEREILGILSLTVIGGFEPLGDLIATALHLLLDLPDVRTRLRADPALIPLAVDETLRLESPIPFTARVCTTGYRDQAVELPPGAPVLAVISAANRDPAVFDAPDVFSLNRSPNPHLALGAGAHFCLGAPVVRLSAELLLAELLLRRPGIARAGAARWRGSLVPHGLTRLPVTW